MTATTAMSPPLASRLADLGRGTTAVVRGIEFRQAEDAIATRLEDLGFVPGESLRVIALGPVGGDPLVVQVGYTRFALRRSEAQRVLVDIDTHIDTAGPA